MNKYTEFFNSASSSVRPSREGTGLDTLASYILLAVVFLLPFFFFPGTVSLTNGKALLFAAAVLAALVIWLIGRLKEGTFSFVESPTLVAAAGIVLVAFLAAVFSPVMKTSLSGFVYEPYTAMSLLFLFAFLFLVVALFRTERSLLRLYAVLVLSFSILFLFHLLRLVAGVDVLSFGGFFMADTATPLGRWNDLALFSGFISILAVLAIDLLTLPKRANFFFAALLAAALFLLAIVNLYSIWVILSLLVLVVFVYHFSVARFAKSDNIFSFASLPRASLVVLIVAVVFLIAGGTVGGFLSSVFNVNSVEVRPSWGSTIDTIRATWDENILLGAGPERYVNQWLAFKPQSINSTIFWNTDFRSGIGLIPTFAVTTGLLGLLSWLAFFGLLLYRGFRSLFAFTNPLERFLVFSSFLAAVYGWAAALFYVPGFVMVMFAFLMTGVFVSFLASKKMLKTRRITFAGDPRVGFVSVLVMLALLVGGAVGLYAVFQKSLSLAYYQKGRTAFVVDENLSEARQYFLRAAEQNQRGVFYRALAEVETVRLSVILRNDELSPDNARAQFQEALGAALEAGKRAVQIDETDYKNWRTLARAYAAVVPLGISGAYENARASLEKAQSLNPQSPILMLERAQLESVADNIDNAREYARNAIAMKNNYTDAIYFLAQVEIGEGNAKKAIQSVEEASYINPNDAGLFFRLGLLKYSNDDFRGAASAFDRAVTLIPDYANARYFLGLSLYELGRRDDAISQFEALAEANPDNSEVAGILTNLKRGLAPFSNIEPEPEPPEEREEPPIEE